MNAEKSNQVKRNIVITGASRGMGYFIAEKFCKEGYNLFVCSRNEEQLLHSIKELKSKFEGIEILGYAADLSDKASAINFGKWVNEHCDVINILVNNAGQYFPGNIYNEDEDALEKMISVNLYSAYNLTRQLLPKMMEQKQAHIFNICSIASLSAYPNGGSYSISKYAMMGFSKNLRLEMMPFNIKVTAIYPGAVYTDSWEGSGVSRSRIMEPNDIAEVIYSAATLSAQACIEDIVLRPQSGDL